MSKNVFNTVAVRKPATNTFNLSHDVKYTMMMGTLTPILLQECLPGDVFNISTETLVRFAPLVAPVMHRINVYTHYFFVPNRIVWDSWQDFISPDLSKDTPPAAPIFSDLSFGKGNLADYFGLPTNVVLDDISAIPFAAYSCIWNEYYRDQNLQDPVDYKLVNGNNTTRPDFSDLVNIRWRAWQHDYFTGSLPFAQKGPAVDLPLGGTLDVYLDEEDTPNQFIRRTTGGNFTPTSAYDVRGLDTGDPATRFLGVQDGGNDWNVALDPNGSLKVDLSGQATINDFRVALRMQEFFEKAARGGSRYIEQIRMHFATIVPDYRLDRPEFLGGTVNPVVISEVLQTSESSETPQANMAGHGLSANSGRNVRYRCQEHGYIIGIQSIMPVTAYQQGVPRHFSRQSWEDYAWPTFAHLGEQAVLNKEIYYDDDGLNEDTFGYVPRFSEYRYTPSRVAGEFRDTLAFWHLGRIFENRPNLNEEFIMCQPRTDIFAVQEENNQNLWCHSFNKLSVRRALPKYGTPTL